MHVGHSTGGGEVARYIGRHGTRRVAKAVLIGAMPPLMLKTPANPGGLPIEVFDGIRAGVPRRSLAVLPGSRPARSTAPTGPARRSRRGCATSFWLQGMQAGLKNAYDCIEAFSETDHTEDLKKFDVPTLILHGDDDQIVPIGASALLVGEARHGLDAEDLPGRRATASARPTRTRSTPTCSHSSRLDDEPALRLLVLLAALASPALASAEPPKLRLIDPADAVLLMLDHQTGLFQTVKDIPLPELRTNAIVLAKGAVLAKVPVITTASEPNGPNGPLMPELHEAAPGAIYVRAQGRDQRLGERGLREDREGHRAEDADHGGRLDQRVRGVPGDPGEARRATTSTR